MFEEHEQITLVVARAVYEVFLIFLIYLFINQILFVCFLNIIFVFDMLIFALCLRLLLTNIFVFL